MNFDHNVHRKICENAKLYPRKVAIQFNDEAITYQELELKIKCLSKRLQAEGVKKGDIVAVCIPNSIQLIVAIYAILYNRAIVLPVDINTPVDRIQKVFSASQPVLILCNKKLHNEITLNVNILAVDSISLDIDNKATDYIEVNTSEDDFAFCIYTSGSTGVPKGVLLSYKGVLNHAKAKVELLNISCESKLCLSFNIGFVASIWQILVPILSGAVLLLYDNDLIKKPYHFFSQIEKDSIIAVSVTPHTLQAYMKYVKIKNQKISFTNTSYIILTGEKLPHNLVEDFYKYHHATTLINAYGQTECSDDTYHYIIPHTFNAENVPIGTSIKNIKGFVINDDLNEDDIGELYIGGIGVADGYLNNKELTSSKFVSLPIFEGHLYKTGDLVRKDGDTIIYIGRMDNQVKIRGHRVELEEIEAAIDNFKGILQSIVRTVNFNETDKTLEAIYVGTQIIDKGTLQEFLKKKLPDYMIPVKFTQIESFKYTPNGKIDRKNIDTIVISDTVTNDSKAEDELSVIHQRAFAIIKTNLDETFSNITINTDLYGAGIDSITFIKIVVSLEAEFDFEFDDEMLLFTAFPTLSSMIEYVQSKVLGSSNGEKDDQQIIDDDKFQ